ncbi:MAG: hypothetical protein GXP37_05375 [Chloroflexi bacterium]|nr:hypothetical protein [Chloroflexota bacterium]
MKGLIRFAGLLLRTTATLQSTRPIRAQSVILCFAAIAAMRYNNQATSLSIA